MFALKNAKNIEIDRRTLCIFKSSENPHKVIRKKNKTLKEKRSTVQVLNHIMIKNQVQKKFRKTMYKKGKKP